ncbi:hypothetical protein SAY86_014795 [Trapa natans]|uniref:peroxidase n=1 Tax=Trapa natans TaxID=22666 RepID=A0AAN7QGL5_TRANT|nr:hypothetical protein SAY86_014795 [Trapa natans]
MAKALALLLSFLLVGSSALANPSNLKVGFYQKTCPSAETIVRDAVKNALAADPGIPAALIRLHFHDCFVRGCDGSVLLDSTPRNVAEKDSSANLGIGGFDVVDAAKSKIEAQCPGVVSCADIVAFAARDGVRSAGGVYYPVPAGRRDGRVSLAADAAKNLPGSFFNVEQLKQNFARKGLSLEEVVTLSGAHSIGDSHCSAFKKRLYSFSSAYPQDPSLNIVTLPAGSLLTRDSYNRCPVSKLDKLHFLWSLPSREEMCAFHEPNQS